MTPVSELVHLERPAAGTPEGLLVLHHGRGADERDLLPLADALDPDRRLHVVTPGGPFAAPGWPGRHWYLVPRVGYPDPSSFAASFQALSALHDRLWSELGLGPERTVLGGFSMGAVMSLALGLSGERPAPAGLMALSGFIPTVAGWRAELTRQPTPRVLLAHGRRDGVIDFSFALQAQTTLSAAGLAVEFHPFDGGHQVDPASLPLLRRWLSAILGPEPDR